MKARRKSDGKSVDIYYWGEQLKGGKIYKEYGSEKEYSYRELVFESIEKIESYWFNFRNHAATAAMQSIIADSRGIPSDAAARVAVEYADALISELKK